MALHDFAGRAVLFSEAHQQVFELNETAAFLWERLASGATAETLAADLARCGVQDTQAELFVKSSLASWGDLGLVGDAAPPTDNKDEPGSILSVEITGKVVRLETRSRSLAQALDTVLGHLRTATRIPDQTIEAIPAGSQVLISQDGRLKAACSPTEAVPAIKALLTDFVLQGEPRLALHVATLIKQGRATLLSGQPGAGKTTLACALTAAGYTYAGDDIALLDAQGEVAGVPFAPAIKAGSWAIVTRFQPDLEAQPIYSRPDGQLVRYSPLPPSVPQRSHPVERIVLLRRETGQAAHLVPASSIAALRELLAGATSPGQRLTPDAFAALTALFETARPAELFYDAAGDVVRALENTDP